MVAKRWPAAVFSLWVLFVSSRYVVTVVRGFRSPFNYGNDVEWFGIWLLTAIALIVLAVTVKRALAFAVVLLGAACLLVLILSGTLLAALVTTGVLGVAHLAGSSLLLLLNIDSDDLALTVPIGLIPLALGGFVLAALHILTPVSILIMLAAFAATKPFLSANRAPSVRPSQPRYFFEGMVSASNLLPILLIAPVVLLNLTWAVVPEIQFDANNYHLAVSQMYLRAHGFVDLPYFFHSYFYRFIEMLFTIALALKGAAAAKLLSFAFGLVAALGVFSLGRLAFDERTAAWATAFFYTTPMVSWLSGTAYIDNAIAMLLTSTAIAFLKWYQNKDQSGWLYAAALLGGATVASKVNGAFGLAAMLGIALWHLRRQPKTLAACALLFLAVALPWYALTYHWTGNPVFPLLNGIFKSPAWDLKNSVMDASTYGIGVSVDALLRLPFRLTWDTNRFSPGAPRGATGVMLLFAFPFAAAMLTKKKFTPFLLMTATLYLLLWAFVFQNARYYVHILPIICVLGTATIFYLVEDRWTVIANNVCLAVVLIFQFPATSMMLWNDYERFPVRAALGIEPSEEFMNRSLWGYAAVVRLNTLIKPGDRVLGGDGLENLRFYLEAPLETMPDSTTSSVLRIASSQSDEKLWRTLREAGFAYVFASRETLKNPPVWEPFFTPQFLQQFATQVFADSNTVVYRLNS